MKKLLAAVLLFATWPCSGQQGTTGQLTGIVTTAGQALPGVTVTLASDALQRNRTTITGANGGYLFTLVPPADYVLDLDLEGFTPAEKRVHVSLAETARADVAMNASPFHEEIVVKAVAARAADDPSIGTNFDSALLQQLPGPRDIRAITLLSPNTNSLGIRNGVVIAGAPSWDSLYIVDGVAASAYLSGQPHNVVLEDAIQEIAVLSGAISAEYGRFTGGVVSTLTKSGGNDLSGSLRDTLTNPKWTTRTPWPGQPPPLDQINHAAEATLGGFLIKDRFWFFTAFRSAESTSSQFSDLTNIPYSSPAHDRRWETKLTGQITPQHALVLSYADASLEEENVLDTRGGGNVLDLGSLISDRVQPTRLLATTYDGIMPPNATAEVQFSQKRYALRGNGGLTSDRILGTLIRVRNVGNLNAPFGCGICGDDERDSKSLAAKSSIYRNTRWGNHTAVIGAEGFHEARTNAGTRSSSEFNIVDSSARIVGQNVYPVFGPTTLIDWTQPFPGDRGSNLNTASAYLNDRWDINSRATINLGFRYDRNNARDAAGRLISNDAAWSPRLSAMFDLRNDGRQQLLASFGRYTAKILEGGGSSQQVGTFNQYGWQYGGPVINGSNVPDNQLLSPTQALAMLFAWFDSVGGTQNRQFLSFITTPDTSSVFHGSLQSPSVDERSLGYAFRLRHGYVRADLIARDWHHFYAARVDHTTGQQADPAGNKIDVVWVVNDNSETVRRYRALQLQGSWESGKVHAGGGYVWSTLRGNDDEEEEVTATAPTNLPLSLWYPELLGYPQRRPFGYLKQDERNRARIWIAYDAGPMTAFLLQRFDSGSPYSAVAGIDPAKVLPNPGYALNQVSTGPYYFSKRGAFRTDDVYSTDAAVQLQIPVPRARLFAKLVVLNALNNRAVVSPDTLVLDRLRNGPPFLAFDPFTQTPIPGVHYQLSPTFGKPTGPDSYQAPRTFEVAIGAHY